MKNSNAILILSAWTLAGIGGCSRNQTPPPPSAAAAGTPTPVQTAQVAAGSVAETMDAAGYTYLKVKTSGGEIWAAASQFKVKVGDKVIVPIEMPMENFHSNTLKRTFPVIYFTSKVFFQGEPGAPAVPQ